MNRLRIGMVGLGSIAQRVYLPLLTREQEWSFAGVFTPNVSKRHAISSAYRVPEFASLADLIQGCDAAFVHSSTISHFEVVSQLLRHDIDVYVDKPLAATLDEAERLVELSQKTGCKLMVGFNRRFAPFYLKLKEQAPRAAWIRMEKHRRAGLNSTVAETLLDDYIHLVDTVRWLGETDTMQAQGWLQADELNRLHYAYHTYTLPNNRLATTAMHRQAGSDLELLELVTTGRIVRVRNMEILEVEEEGACVIQAAAAWDTILKRRGFEAAINHFIRSILGDTIPLSNGEEALKTQLLLTSLLNS
uniref:Virulence factor MviM n=1 Tax=Thermosporothrix sp. COM3 TaxID=2490863 RepID=A0A455SB68_9CHLR|nr:virulence factor MviM [Thermosporothrix sp. COM3]